MSIRPEAKGFLFIGDPHLASRVPGFRKDDYPKAILQKLRWCLDYAESEQLQPVLLGDLFHWPRDNANWLVAELIQMLMGRGLLSIVGNHDTTEKILTDDDSLSVIHAAGVIRLIDQTGSWTGTVGGKKVLLGGTMWSARIPEAVDRQDADLVIWLTHHNVGFVDGDEGWLRPAEIPGIDIVINGHIHTPKLDVVRGCTTWMNPGNISRVQRADAVRSARPAVLRIDLDSSDAPWKATRIDVPHASFDEVFHPLQADGQPEVEGSAFIRGLEELTALRTAGGAGLMQFLHNNLNQFEPDVAAEILSLAQEVCDDDTN